MKTLKIKLPETAQVDSEDIKFTIAVYLYGKSVLSLGQAASVAEVSKRTFIELLGKFGGSVFNYPKEELKEDFKNA